MILYLNLIVLQYDSCHDLYDLHYFHTNYVNASDPFTIKPGYDSIYDVVVTLEADGCIYANGEILRNGEVYSHDYSGSSECEEKDLVNMYGSSFYQCIVYICTYDQPTHCEDGGVYDVGSSTNYPSGADGRYKSGPFGIVFMCMIAKIVLDIDFE